MLHTHTHALVYIDHLPLQKLRPLCFSLLNLKIKVLLSSDMGSRVWTASGTLTHNSFHRKSFLSTTPFSKLNPFCLVSPKTHLNNIGNSSCTEKQSRGICLIVMEKKTEDYIKVSEGMTPKILEDSKEVGIVISRTEQILARKRKERDTYLVAALLSSLGVSSAAILAVYYRFSWQMQVKKKTETHVSVFISELKFDHPFYVHLFIYFFFGFCCVVTRVMKSHLLRCWVRFL